MEAAPSIDGEEAGRLWWNNGVSGGGKMGRLDSCGQWMGGDGQRLRGIIWVMVIARLAHLRQDLICLIFSQCETTGRGLGCQDLSQRVAQPPGRGPKGKRNTLLLLLLYTTCLSWG